MAVDAFIYDALTADETLMAAVTSVCEHPAPYGTDWPVVTFGPYGNGTDTTTLDGTRVASAGLWLVRVIGCEMSTTELAALYTRVDVALQQARGVNEFGTVYGLVRQGPFRLVELDDGVTYRTLGGIYKAHYGA